MIDTAAGDEFAATEHRPSFGLLDNKTGASLRFGVGLLVAKDLDYVLASKCTLRLVGSLEYLRNGT